MQIGKLNRGESTQSHCSSLAIGLCLLAFGAVEALGKKLAVTLS